MSISKNIFLLVFIAWGTIKSGEGWAHYPRSYVANDKDDRDSEFSLEEKNLPKGEDSSRVEDDEDSGEEYLKEAGARGAQTIRLAERTRRCEKSDSELEDGGEPKLAGVPDEAEYRAKEDGGSAPVASWLTGKFTTCQPRNIQELARAYKCMVMAAKQFIKAANRTEDEPSAAASDGSTETSLYEHLSRRKKVSESGTEEEASPRKRKSSRSKGKAKRVTQSEEQVVQESAEQDMPSNPDET